MNLAIKLYGVVDVSAKPTNIPDTWPCEVRELGESTDLPDETWVLMTSDAYSTYRASKITEYVAWASVYYATTPAQIVSAKILKAMDFGKSLIIQFACENVLMGITAAGKTGVCADYLQKLSYYISSGSLYQAVTEINTLIANGLDSNLAPFITEARLNTYKDKILAFLSS